MISLAAAVLLLCFPVDSDTVSCPAYDRQRLVNYADQMAEDARKAGEVARAGALSEVEKQATQKIFVGFSKPSFACKLCDDTWLIDDMPRHLPSCALARPK